MYHKKTSRHDRASAPTNTGQLVVCTRLGPSTFHPGWGRERKAPPLPGGPLTVNGCWGRERTLSSVVLLLVKFPVLQFKLSGSHTERRYESGGVGGIFGERFQSAGEGDKKRDWGRKKLRCVI